MAPLRSLLVAILLALPALAADPKVAGLRFPLGEASGANPPAKVRVEQLLQGSQKRGFLRVAILPLLVVDGITITFQKPDATCLSTFPETLQALTKADKFELRRIALVSHSDPSPKLTAEELLISSKTVWVLKNPRVPGLDLPKEVRLLLEPGQDGGLSLADGTLIPLHKILGMQPGAQN